MGLISKRLIDLPYALKANNSYQRIKDYLNQFVKVSP